MSLARRPLFAGGPTVSALGFGAGHIGGEAMTEDHAGWLLNAAVDRGVTLIDTARGYGLSEQRVGRHLSYRRGDFTLVSKCGYGIPGQADWTGACITAGVDAALGHLHTDHVDGMLLHSCPREVLERGEVIDALDRAVQAGKVRWIGYSGENDDLAFAVHSGRFRVVEASVNVCDQRVLDQLAPEIVRRGMGLIAKRPLANAPWRFQERPVGQYVEPYWERYRAMGLDGGGIAEDEQALRFAAFAPGVSVAIAGTASLDNLSRNVEMVERGALPDARVAELRSAFKTSDREWVGQV